MLYRDWFANQINSVGDDVTIGKNEHICLKCEKLMTKTRSGFKLRVEFMQGVQSGDIWECGDCGAKVLSGFAHEWDFGKKSEDLYIEKLIH